ncbi:glycosyltransferase family 4 protein [Candidatus Uhrbacteria bacterium]|nr:glycosyltransferase family 4 protein [Candidatus Uhrbacteria bacterium]
MKILFIQPTADKRGHYGIYTMNLCQELARAGHEVCLFTNKVAPEKFLTEPHLFKIIEYGHGVYSFTKFDEKRGKIPLYYEYGYIKNCFIILWAALKFLKKNPFDVVQCFDFEYSVLSVLLMLNRKALPPVALMISAPNFSFYKYPGPFVLRFYKILQKAILKSAIRHGAIKSIVTLGKFHEKGLSEQLSLPPDYPVRVIYDGAKPPQQNLTTREARQKLGINFDGPIFLFFGILRRDKGIEYLLEAVSRVKQNFRLLIAGSPFDYTEAEVIQLIKSLGIEDKVILKIGYIPEKEVYNYFCASNALILPYIKIYTGGSGPLLKEAAICKVPAIVSNVSEMGPLVNEHQMGLVVEPENPQELALAMEKFVNLPLAEQKQLGENAFKVANTWTKMAQEYIELFNITRTYGSKK